MYAKSSPENHAPTAMGDEECVHFCRNRVRQTTARGRFFPANIGWLRVVLSYFIQRLYFQ